MVDNKQLKPTAPTLRETLTFCIALCSVQLFGSVVLGEHDFILEFDYDEEQRKFLHKEKLKRLDTTTDLSYCTITLFHDSKSTLM